MNIFLNIIVILGSLSLAGCESYIQDLHNYIYCSGGRRCFKCLNGEYSSPTNALLPYTSCGTFDDSDESITMDCPRTDRCYIASLNQTL